MKPELFAVSLVCILCAHCLYANESLFAYDTEWHYRTTDCINGTTSLTTATVHDSLVNGIVYQEIAGALLRAEGAQVWCVIDSAGTMVEQLLYDFGLQVGDSIRTLHFPEYDPYDPPFYAKVTRTETILLPDGRSASRITYEGRPDDIEHIGNVNGVLGATIQLLPPCGVYSDFICCTRGDNVLYEIASGECDKSTAIDDLRTEHSPVHKVIRTGQLLIQNGERTYTPQGIEVMQ